MNKHIYIGQYILYQFNTAPLGKRIQGMIIKQGLVLVLGPGHPFSNLPFRLFKTRQLHRCLNTWLISFLYVWLGLFS